MTRPTALRPLALVALLLAYYLAANDASKAFHKNVCQEAKKATVTGTEKKVGEKHVLTATKITLVQ